MLGSMGFRRLTRRIAARLFALVALVALVGGLIVGGRAYVFCTLMGAPMWSSCCPHTADASESPRIETRCCEPRHFDAVPPSAAPDPGVIIAAARLVAFLPPVVEAPDSDRSPRVLRPVSRGPPPLDERLSLLSVRRL